MFEYRGTQLLISKLSPNMIGDITSIVVYPNVISDGMTPSRQR
jgi:hypothetical protein